jgi:hypothetical protein
MLARGKHSSLLRKSVNYGRKKFYGAGPWSNTCKLTFEGSVIFLGCYVMKRPSLKLKNRPKQKNVVKHASLFQKVQIMILKSFIKSSSKVKIVLKTPRLH